MYSIAIIVNHNEVTNSNYANIIAQLQESAKRWSSNGRVSNSFKFTQFDKFNITNLFEEKSQTLLNFDALILATNSLNNIEIIETLRINKSTIKEFLKKGKGLFISSQKKLSNGSLNVSEFSSSGFIPADYDYYLFDRPEKSSSDGSISICNQHPIVKFPYLIDEETIEKHCNINKFIKHKYRSLIFCTKTSNYKTILWDNNSSRISKEDLNIYNSSRHLLVSSLGRYKIIISSIAVDWSGHDNMLFNILNYLIESKPRLFFVSKNNPTSTTIDNLNSYLSRADSANVPFSLIDSSEINKMSSIGYHSFVYSSDFSSKEIDQEVIPMFSEFEEKYNLFHLTPDNTYKGQFKVVKYSNYSSLDIISTAIVKSIIANYRTTHWNKSIWTIAYITNLLSLLNIDISPIVNSIYGELIKHFTKLNERTKKRTLIYSYDNVVNSTVKLLETLRFFEKNYSEKINQEFKFKIHKVREGCDDWINTKINKDSVHGQDACFVLSYKLKSQIFQDDKNKIREKLIRLTEYWTTNLVIKIDDTDYPSESLLEFARAYNILCQKINEDISDKDHVIIKLYKFESYLIAKQSDIGSWGNASVTSGILSEILDVIAIRYRLDQSTDDLDNLMAKGIEYLYSYLITQNTSSKIDLDNQAKILYAIWLYDRHFNFAVNDFFIEMNKGITPNSVLHNSTQNDINNLYDNIEKEVNENKRVSIKLENVKDKMQHAIIINKKLKKITTVSLAVLFFISFLFVLLLLSVWNSDGEIKYILLKNWTLYLIGGFFSFLVSSLGVYLFSRFKRSIPE